MESGNHKQKTTVKIAEIHISYKSKVKPSQRPKIISSKEAYDIQLENCNKG